MAQRNGARYLTLVVVILMLLRVHIGIVLQDLSSRVINELRLNQNHRRFSSLKSNAHQATPMTSAPTSTAPSSKVSVSSYLRIQFQTALAAPRPHHDSQTGWVARLYAYEDEDDPCRARATVASPEV